MPPSRRDSPTDALNDAHVVEAVKRGLIEIKGDRVTYNLGTKKTYNWADPEEWVRARTVAFLVVARGYPINRIRTEVQVPRRTPSDFADIVVYRDDKCREPYLVVENKSIGQTVAARKQWIEQAFGNANSLRAPLALYDEHVESRFFDVANYPAGERVENLRGGRDSIPAQYGDVPEFPHIAGQEGDIAPAKPSFIEGRIRRAQRSAHVSSSFLRQSRARKMDFSQHLTASASRTLPRAVLRFCGQPQATLVDATAWVTCHRARHLAPVAAIDFVDSLLTWPVSGGGA